MNDQNTVKHLLYWLAGYVALLVVICWASGKLTESISIVANLVSAFSGAAFAIMRAQDGGGK